MTVRPGNRSSRCEDGQFGLIEIRVAERAADFSAIAKVRPLRCGAAVALQLIAISPTRDGQPSGFSGYRNISILID
jgi:hypothetical protein